MRTNTQFAVAIHIMTMLAHVGDEALVSEMMAGSVNTNPVFIRRILGSLHRAGLVSSQPGVGGGWRLLRDPAAITLLDIYQAVDAEHLLALHHSEPNPDCEIGRVIAGTLQVYFSEAEQAFAAALARRTLAEVLDTAERMNLPNTG